MDPLSPGAAVLFDPEARTWLGFGPPKHVICATRVSEVAAALCRVEESVNSANLYAVGFLSYEASPAFDSACEVRPSGGFPLLWFGLYAKPRSIELPKSPQPSPPYSIGRWKPSLSGPEYRRAFSRIKKCIGRGETYQVNYSLRLRAPFSGNCWRFFADLAADARAGYSAFVNTGRFVICSASPELFFRLKGHTLVSRPMKGTAPRGRFPREDIERRKWLALSVKNRAENVMIVDMIRNDMGKIAATGSVSVDKLFTCESYPTLWQMTSTVQARSRAPVAKILSALFPCASITGAPKVATMRIIARCETSPRRIYCGCIGSLAPRRKAQFGVAIRTVLIDRKLHRAEYGVGGGIVWQSRVQEEFDECMAKARVLSRMPGEFSLLESILWTPGSGYFLLALHMERLKASAAYFGFIMDPARITRRLARHARSAGPKPRKVRLLLALGSCDR